MLPKRNAVHLYIINQIEIDKGARLANKHRAQGPAIRLPYLMPGLRCLGTCWCGFLPKLWHSVAAKPNQSKANRSWPTQTRNLESGDFWQLLCLANGPK